VVSIHQESAQIKNQFVADIMHLGNASFDSADRNGDDVLPQLRQTMSAVTAAVRLGYLDADSGAALSEALRGAIDNVESGDAESASQRVKQASGLLQTAAPIAAIGAGLATVWKALSGGV
jgi:hypothetical protein